ncbi:MAG: Hpt domain-containing protein [Planctomycetota bacterium]
MNNTAYDVAIIEEIFEMDPRTCRDVIQTFDHHWAEQVALMQQASAQEDLDALMQAAHKLKGGSRTIGLLQVGELCHRLECAARNGDHDSGRELLPQIAPAAREACAWLRLQLARLEG